MVVKFSQKLDTGSNKPENHAVHLTAAAYWYERPTGYRVTLLKPKIDNVERASLKDFRFHDLRHTAASYLAMGGATPHEIAEVLGHKSLEMTRRYAHLSEPHVDNVVESMNERMFKNDA